jgi:hypothetical protein
MQKHLINNWQQQTIEYLEQKDFGNPDEASTPLIKRCIQLSKLPLNAFTAAHLRLMIGQGFALQYLIPLAIKHLLHDLFTETEYYPGDLLSEVLSVYPSFWKNHPQLWAEVHTLIAHQKADLALHKIDTTLFEQAVAAM